MFQDFKLGTVFSSTPSPWTSRLLARHPSLFCLSLFALGGLSACSSEDPPAEPTTAPKGSTTSSPAPQTQANPAPTNAKIKQLPDTKTQATTSTAQGSAPTSSTDSKATTTSATSTSTTTSASATSNASATHPNSSSNSNNNNSNSAPKTCKTTQDCQDGSLCNGKEFCLSGTCRPGRPVDCNDFDPCTQDQCVDPSGECFFRPADDGSSCGPDGQSCKNGSCFSAQGDPIARVLTKVRGAVNSPLARTLGADWKVREGSYQIRDVSHKLATDKEVKVYSLTRNYHCFDLSKLKGKVKAAKLRIRHPKNSYNSPDPQETFLLFAVDRVSCDQLSQPVSKIPKNWQEMFDDIGDGDEFGRIRVTAKDAGTFSEIDLNEKALASLQAALGSNQAWVIGGRLESGTPKSGTQVERIFRGTSSNNSPPTQLLLTLGEEAFCDPATCDDNNECTESGCNAQKQCVHEPKSNDTVCGQGEDKDRGRCQDGVCKIPQCDPAKCDDGNECSVSSCNDQDQCHFEPKPNQSPCGAGQNKGDGRCLFGVCVFPKCEPAKCDDGNECTKSGCNERDECVHELRPDLSLCNQGQGRCKAGACLDANDPCLKLDCDDKNECTVDSCDKDKGCVNEPAQGQLCNDDTGRCSAAGVCKCDDDACNAFMIKNPCVISMKPWGRVTGLCMDNACTPGWANMEPAGTICGESKWCIDGNGAIEKGIYKIKCEGDVCLHDAYCRADPCNPGKCIDGACQSLTEGRCPDDGNPCTADVCVEGRGCGDILADGTPCGSGLECLKGACVQQSNAALVSTTYQAFYELKEDGTVRQHGVGYFIGGTEFGAQHSSVHYHFKGSYTAGKRSISFKPPHLGRQLNGFSERRAYFIFDTKDIQDAKRATIRIWGLTHDRRNEPPAGNRVSSYNSVDPEEVYGLFELNRVTPEEIMAVPIHTWNEKHLPNFQHPDDRRIFEDLGDGRMLGLRLYTPADEETDVPHPLAPKQIDCSKIPTACGKWQEFVLSAAAVQQINATKGLWGVGMRLITASDRVRSAEFRLEWINLGSQVSYWFRPPGGHQYNRGVPAPQLVVER